MSEAFSGRKGKFVSLEDTVSGFAALLNGEGDDYPEQAFYLVGKFEEAVEEGIRLAKASSSR